MSVVIPVLDDAERLEGCLTALDAQTYQGPFEVLVVDNGSAQAPDPVVAGHPRARLLREDHRSSYSARNTGVRAASGDVLAFTDSDCLPYASWLEEGVRALLTAPRPCVVAGRVEVFAADDARRNAAELHDVVDGFPQERYATKLHFGVTANLLVHAADFEAVGPFHDGLSSGGDMEWGQRAHASGLDVLYARDAVVRHPARRSTAAVVRKAKRVQGGHDDLRRLRGGPPEAPALLRSALRPPLKTAMRAARDRGLAPDERARFVSFTLFLHYAKIAFRLRYERRRSWRPPGSRAPAPRPLVVTNVLELRGNPYLSAWNAAVVRSGGELALLTQRSVRDLASRPRAERWVHLQWPERALYPTSRRDAARLTARMLVLVLGARLLGSRILVTAHNLRAHDRSHRWIERVMWWCLGPLTTDLHGMTSAGTDEFLQEHRSFRHCDVHVIAHGDYSPSVGAPPDRDQARAALDLPLDVPVIVTFGSLKRYKGLDELVGAHEALASSPSRPTLFVAGRAGDDETAAVLQRLSGRPDVVVEDRFLDDDELHRIIRAADLVVLPYRRVLNSGSALLSLTLGTPVLLPSTPTFDELREGVGSGWIETFRGDLTSRALSEALSAAPSSGRPDLSDAAWTKITAQLTDLWTSERS